MEVAIAMSQLAVAQLLVVLVFYFYSFFESLVLANLGNKSWDCTVC